MMCLYGYTFSCILVKENLVTDEPTAMARPQGSRLALAASGQRPGNSGEAVPPAAKAKAGRGRGQLAVDKESKKVKKEVDDGIKMAKITLNKLQATICVQSLAPFGQ
jgi:hypothetical protein